MNTHRIAQGMIVCLVGAVGCACAEDVMKPSEGTVLPQSNRPLAERFANPPAASRILKIVHGLPDAPQDQDGLFQTLIAKGFGGVVTNVSFTDYLESDSKWDAFVRGVRAAKKLGMALWLYDERGYPSGNAGGITMRDHPEWEALGLLIADTATEGGAVKLDLPPGTLVLAKAFPVENDAIVLDKAVDLAAHVQDRSLAWDAPSGSWRVMAVTEDRLYEGTHAAVSLADKLPYVNLLMPEPTERFLEVTHDRYAAHLGKDLGQWFVATFTDEPSLMSMFMRKQPWRVLPWAPAFAHEFEARRGYALAPLIPALIAEAGPKGSRARYDFWLTVGELVSENFFGQIQTRCRKYDIPSGGHLLLEEPLLTHVPMYGDFFRCVRRVDAPSIDCLTSLPGEVPWFIARLIGSVADLEGRPVTMSETSDHSQHYRPEGDTRPVRVVTEDEIRGTCNKQSLNGITTITSYYSFKDLDDVQLVRLNEWVGRCSTMLEGGHQVADIAVVYPIESVWPHFEPSRHWTNDAPSAAKRIETAYRTAAESLYAAGRDFTFVDARAITDSTVQDGALRHAPMQWRVVVLPCVDTLPLAAWKKLAEFWQSGGVVIALTTLPANSETEFPSADVQALANDIFGGSASCQVHTNEAKGAGVFLGSGSEALMPRVLDSLLDAPMRVAGSHSPLRMTHRRLDDHDVYFVINDSSQAWEGRIGLPAEGAGEQWDPATGQSVPCASSADVDLHLGAYGGMFYRFAQARLPERHALPEGGLPGMTASDLSIPTPHVGQGQYVEGGVSPAGESWEAKATLTKGNVDTFQFAVMDFAQPVDLKNAACLSIDTWAPAGQHAHTGLLVVLRDTSGMEYFAETGRWLSDPGDTTSFISIERFQRAAWRDQPDRPFDFGSVSAMLVGWGGYLGAEGEEVVFRFGHVRLVRPV